MKLGFPSSRPAVAAALLIASAAACVAGAWYAAALGSRCLRLQNGLQLAAVASFDLSALLDASPAPPAPLGDAVARLDTALRTLGPGDRREAADPIAQWRDGLRARVLAAGAAPPEIRLQLARRLQRLGRMLQDRSGLAVRQSAAASAWRNALLLAALLSLAGLAIFGWRLRPLQGRHTPIGDDAPLAPAPGEGSLAAELAEGGGSGAAAPSQTSLELWHGMLTRLLEDPDSVEPFILLLREIEELTGAMSSAIVVTSGPERQTVLLACTYAKDRERFASFARNPPADMRVAGYGEVRIYDDPSVHGYRFVASRLRQGELGFGFLLLRMPPAVELSHNEIALLNLHGERLASIIYGTRRARQTLRVAQYQERAAIARELHDSLAQSLSYLKIQAARLQSLMGRDEPVAEPAMRDEVDSVLQELRENLNVAYRQLRELITTFRLTMRGRSFAQALEDSVDEFAKRSSIAFDVDNRLPGGVLSVAEELQLLQIIREALSNAVRHSHASYVEVSVSSVSDGILRVTIDDDGIGTDLSRRRARNHGIIIMQERAQSLKGEMRIENAPGGGTRVLVQFRPSKYSGNPQAVN